MIKPAGIPFDDGTPVEPDEETEVLDTSFDISELEVDYEVEKPPVLPAGFPAECDNFFAPEGLLSQYAVQSGFKSEQRPQQREMAAAIAEALLKNHNLCVEAPTGVGKSFAYLIPLIFRARYGGRPAIVSTETINLQEQLIKKDIPFLSKVLNTPIKAVLAKGRRNYLCRRRFSLLQGEQRDKLLPMPSLAMDIERLHRWIEGDVTGTRDDLDFRIDPETWNLVCCESGNCLGPKCPFYRNCCYFKARKQWEDADIVVSNHALFFTDLSMRFNGEAAGALLPNYGAVLFDEAHTLEECAADHLGVRLSRPAVISLLNRIYNPDSARGLLMRSDNIDPGLRGCAAETRSEAYGFFAPFEQFLQKTQESAREVTHPENFPDPLTPKMLKLAAGLQNAADDEEDASFKTELESQVSRCREVVDSLDIFLHQTQKESVYYAEEERAGVSLNAIPLNVAELLDSMLFKQDIPVILCSATLSVRGSFDYFVSRTGFSGKTLRLDSPFSPDQAKLRVIRRMPDPKSGEYRLQLANEILESLKITDGKAFVLFTNYENMRWCSEYLAAEFKANNWLMLIQGDGRSRFALLRDFKEDINSVLFGTDSFWSGVDVPGEALSQVIITKLPFAVPSHPLIAARMKQLEDHGGNSFTQYSLPEAVLKFRQGAGRLIRTKDDRGCITVLDPRLVTKHYGRLFIDSLPYPCEIIN